MCHKELYEKLLNEKQSKYLFPDSVLYNLVESCGFRLNDEELSESQTLLPVDVSTDPKDEIHKLIEKGLLQSQKSQS